MNAEKKKKLILSLIKDDLINSKLVTGLNSIGLQAENFHLHLSETIFDLMGFENDEQSEEVYYQYIMLSKKGCSMDISEGNNTLNKLVLEIYEYLENKKPR